MVLPVSLFVCISAFVIHLIWWRIALPRRQSRAIVLITVCDYVLVLGAAQLVGGEWALSPAQSLHVGMVVFPVLGAYIISYSALEAVSPTVVMTLLLAKAGSDGMDEAAFNAALCDELLVLPRLRDLTRDNMASLDQNGRYHLRPKGRILIAVIGVHRRLLGRDAGG